MSNTTSFDLLRTLLVERMSIDADEIAPEANLRDDLGMDSLDALELAAGLDEDLGIKVPEDELGDLRTVQDVVLRIDQAREGSD
ncbi:acyl carrier protein [Auritidibacter ignavus]|uniref:acyl carrier protein n=1 Tax=Auritidibacter ignavus TaxID=678932 RepID=UPI00109C2089|nr:acyl carrier protein [Auritidibacter ignavus]